MSANTLAFERARPHAIERSDLRDASAPGCGSLAVIRSGGRSVVSRAYATSPLRLLTPANHGPGAWVFTSTFGGGLVDRDHISMEIDIGAGAMALVSTQASTKVYRSRHGTVSTMHARIASGALLALLPDPVVCFANARYRQEQRFDLADDANLVVVDWMTAGRRAAGERWLFDEYVARLFVSHGRRRLVHDVLALRAEDGDVSSRLGRYDVVAIAVMVGPAIAAEAGRIVTQLGAAPIVRCADQLIAASPIDGGGVVRVAGRSAEQVAAVLRAQLGFVRTLLGDDPWARKW